MSFAERCGATGAALRDHTNRNHDLGTLRRGYGLESGISRFSGQARFKARAWRRLSYLFSF